MGRKSQKRTLTPIKYTGNVRIGGPETWLKTVGREGLEMWLNGEMGLLKDWRNPLEQFKNIFGT